MVLLAFGLGCGSRSALDMPASSGTGPCGTCGGGSTDAGLMSVSSSGGVLSSGESSSGGGTSNGGVSTGCVPAPSGIISWWTGDGTLADLERLNPGTADGNVTFAPGEVGEAFVLDGASAVATTTTDFPVGAADRTIELWVYLTSSFGTYPSLTEMFVQYGTFGTVGAAFALFTFGSPSLYWSQWGASFTGGSMSIGVWTHIAVTSSARAITLFEDGQVLTSQALSPYDTPAGTTFYIGGQGADPQGKMDSLTGMADEVTVYDRALSQAEIASIYTAGSAGKCH